MGTRVGRVDGEDRPPVTRDDRLADLQRLGGGTQEPVATFCYVVATGRWTWSAELFELLGLDPAATTPSTDLLAAHYDPDDLGPTSIIAETALERGQPFGSYHRLVDTAGRVRHVLAVGDGRLDRFGHVVTVSGFVVDLSASLRADAQAEVEAAVRGATAHRAEIEQAKGALMMRYRIEADEAFEILRWVSSHQNRKLRDVAAEVVRLAASGTLSAGLLLWEGHLRNDPDGQRLITLTPPDSRTA